MKNNTVHQNALHMNLSKSFLFTQSVQEEEEKPSTNRKILLFCRNLCCSEQLLLFLQARSQYCSELVLIFDCGCLLGIVVTLEIQCVLAILPVLADLHIRGR